MLREEADLPARTDVLVLGAGIAGHCAALAAAEAGAQVVLLEKSGQPGGSSAIAGGAFALTGTDLQRAAGVEESIAAYRADLFTSGKGKNDPVLVDLFLRHQLEAYDFLRAHGVKFAFQPTPPPTPMRIHSTGTGRAISNLHVAARAHPGIRFFTRSAATRLVRSPATGRVEGAEIFFGDREATVTAGCGTVLATGGFSRSRELLQVFAPELTGSIKHGGPANTGDGLMMASALGAALVDMGYVSGSFGGGIRDYPATVADAQEVPPLLFAFLEGAIMVNKHGRRFVDEAQSYKTLSATGLEQPEGIGFQLFDAKLMRGSLADTSVNNYREAMLAGYIREADTIADLAAAMEIDAATLQETVARYNRDVANGRDTEFGRAASLMAIDEPPFYIAPTGNALTSTYGGIAVNGELAVTDWLGQVIPGLYAVGEVVGGFHGGGYYSASSLASSATFGMVVGRHLAATATATVAP